MERQEARAYDTMRRKNVKSPQRFFWEILEKWFKLV